MEDGARVKLVEQKKEEFERRVDDRLWQSVAKKQEREVAKEERDAKKSRKEESSGSGIPAEEAEEGRRKMREKELEEKRDRESGEEEDWKPGGKRVRLEAITRWVQEIKIKINEEE